MTNFRRYFDAINELKETTLFKEKLEADCRKGIVFPAVRVRVNALNQLEKKLEIDNLTDTSNTDNGG